MNEVTARSYPEWLGLMYSQLSEDRVEAVFMMIRVFAKSYQMLTIWEKELKEDPNNYNQINMEVCAATWYDFCIHCQMNKAAIKVLVASKMPDVSQEVHEFCQKNNVKTFYEWLNELQSLADSLPLIRDDRPFFSLVIACYNDGRYVEGKYLDRLLNSVCDQGLAKHELEVILSDDCSPVPFDEIVDKYKDKLQIKRTKTDYNFAPGNTRQKGVDIATGHWLCFADHDDKYYPRALLAVKQFIVHNRERLYVYSCFNSVNTKDELVSKYEETMGWCHGKFYNIDNFWKPQKIHFIHDLASHEDIAICTQVSCALDMMKESTKNKYLNTPTYAWTNNPESVSHSKYSLEDDNGVERQFLEVFFEDYLKSTGYIYMDLFKRHQLPMVYARMRSLEVLCYAYFYTQSFQFMRKDYKKDNLIIAGRYLNECKHLYEIKNNTSVYSYVAENNAAMYRRIRPYADRGAYYMPQQGFKQWLDLIDRYYKQSLNK